MALTFAEVKKDYRDIVNEHGLPYDMTGGFVAETHMEVVVMNPTKATARDYLISVIEYGFQFKEGSWRGEMSGYIDSDDCSIVKRLYDKYMVF